VVMGAWGEEPEEEAMLEEELVGVRMVLPHMSPPFKGRLFLFFFRLPMPTPPPSIVSKGQRPVSSVGWGEGGLWWGESVECVREGLLI